MTFVSTTARKGSSPSKKLAMHEKQKGQWHVCNGCGKDFYRSYPVTGKRAEKPQYCCLDCKKIVISSRADERRETRFWEYVDRRDGDECWPWMAFRDRKGYGKFQWGHGDPRQAHRVAFFYGKGHWPNGYACHSCDNPACCNPKHLWDGTARQNNDDMRAKGRNNQVGPSSENARCAKLTTAAAREIYLSAEQGNALAHRFGVRRYTISAIRARKTWRSATEGLTAPRRANSRLPEAHHD